jgi:AraC family transcriptional regulator of adaptative response/methylated-DNA-[protein]-cysteine methyltransferase
MTKPEHTDDRRWRAVAARDARADGRFVYAVRSTGIYCRPSCPSRRPRRAGVRYFTTPDAAELAGYRECRRCRPRFGAPVPPGLPGVRRACAIIQAHVDQPLTLSALASHADMSPFHLQRMFTRLVGISPRAYQEALRAGAFRGHLRGGRSLAGAIYEAGYGSTSRVYERKPTGEGMTPAAYRVGGAGLVVRYTISDSPLGRLLVAGTPHGVCAVKLGGRDGALEADLRAEYPRATIEKDDAGRSAWVRAILAHLAGRAPHVNLPIDVRATAFQWTVWRHLQSIPWGETRTYSDVARAIGRPAAARAVARACATNPVALLVPCHRVVGKDGTLAGYRWGIERKQALLHLERARSVAKSRRPTS